MLSCSSEDRGETTMSPKECTLSETFTLALTGQALATMEKEMITQVIQMKNVQHRKIVWSTYNNCESKLFA